MLPNDTGQGACVTEKLVSFVWFWKDDFSTNLILEKVYSSSSGNEGIDL